MGRRRLSGSPGGKTPSACRDVASCPHSRSHTDAARQALDDGHRRECGALSSALTHTAKGLKEMRNFVHPDLARKQRRAMHSPHALLALQALCTLADEIAWSLCLPMNARERASC